MEETRDVSEFNGAQLKMIRINKALEGITMCRHMMDLQHWLFYIVDFEMELESVKKDKEKESLRLKMQELATNINIQLAHVNNPRVKIKATPVKIVQELNDYQVQLLKIFKESGLEMRLAGDASKALN